MKEIRIVGYSSDEVEDRESHVYLVNGSKHYYKVYKELEELQHIDPQVKYLGIGQAPSTPEFLGNILPDRLIKRKKKKNSDTKMSKILGVKILKEKTGNCCYCETMLDNENYTKEHVVPKRVGGRILLPCCRDCNEDKGGFMLHTYIQILELRSEELEDNPVAYNINQTKIKNAKLIAIKYQL